MKKYTIEGLTEEQYNANIAGEIKENIYPSDKSELEFIRRCSYGGTPIEGREHEYKISAAISRIDGDEWEEDIKYIRVLKVEELTEKVTLHKYELYEEGFDGEPNGEHFKIWFYDDYNNVYIALFEPISIYDLTDEERERFEDRLNDEEAEDAEYLYEVPSIDIDDSFDWNSYTLQFEDERFELDPDEFKLLMR